MSKYGLALWIAGSVILLLKWGVFTSQGFKKSPTRQSDLSLPIVGGIILLYIVVQVLCVGVAVWTGQARWDDFGVKSDGPPATMSVALPENGTHPATTQQAPQAASAPATTSTATTAPTTAPEEGATSAHRMVLFNVIGAVTYAVTAIPVLILLWFLFPDRFRGLGLDIRQLAGAWRGAVGFFVYYPIWMLGAFGIAIIYSFFQVEQQDHATFQALEQHPTVVGKWILILGAVVMAPFAEELFFRGILQTTLVQRGFGFLLPQLMRVEGKRIPYSPPAWHRWVAIVVASAAFAYVHEWDAAPMIFLLSLGLGYVYERTGNLWASITLHLLFNLLNMWSFLSGGF